jgi:hypothetical protein
MIALGSQLSAGTLSPDEVSAWRLFKASLAAQECYGDKDAAFGLEPRVASSPSPLPSEAARNLAVTCWQRYGAEAMSRLGCAGQWRALRNHLATTRAVAGALVAHTSCSDVRSRTN